MDILKKCASLCCFELPTSGSITKSQDEQEARPVADHKSECFNGGLQSRVRDGPGVRLKTRETREGARARERKVLL